MNWTDSDPFPASTSRNDFERVGSMKKVVLILLIFGLSVFIISSLAKWQAAEKAERSAEAWRKVDDAVATASRETSARLLESQTRLVRLRHGEAAALLYNLCHTQTPTTKAHQLECKRTDEQFARDEASAAKHPW
jgi:hypothetical protein